VSGLNTVTPGNLVCKYADDSYIIIPASNCHTRLAEIEHIESWSKVNNLTPNRSKTVEVIFVDKKRKLTATLPPPISGISRSTTLKILGVTITGSLSMAGHIHAIVISCPQTLHALRLRVHRSQGLPAEGLFEVYRGVVIAKLLYAASAWWGFTSADDKQRLAAFIRRSIRQGFCAPDYFFLIL